MQYISVASSISWCCSGRSLLSTNSLVPSVPELITLFAQHQPHTVSGRLQASPITTYHRQRTFIIMHFTKTITACALALITLTSASPLPTLNEIERRWSEGESEVCFPL